MSSSFRRRRPRPGGDGTAISGLPGTRPWTGGVTLTSVGLRDLDAILGGGQPLGTSILLEEDRWTRDLALCLTKYWCAEAISHGQTLLIPTTRTEEDDLLSDSPSPLTDDKEDSSSFPLGSNASQIHALLQSLPRNLHWDNGDKQAGSSTGVDSEQSRPLEILQEENEEEAAEEGEGLEIAWQYRKSIQQERLGHSGATTTAASSTADVYCHSYDLSGRMSEQRSIESTLVSVGCDACGISPCRQSRTCGFRLYQRLLMQVKERLASSKQVVRLLLYQAPIQATSVALPLLLAYVRTHQLPVVILVTTQSWTCHAGLVSLRRTSDAVLQTEGFASRVHYPPPPEFRHLHGLLLLPKVSTVTAAASNGHFCDMTTSKRPPAHVYGLKRDRRKLHVPLLHIPPEDYAGGGGSVGGGAVRSGAGRSDKPESTGCGTSSSSSLLDF